MQTNDSVRLSDPTYTTFCDGFTGSSIDQFWQVEEDIYVADYTTAASLNSAVTPTNTVEMNYQTFYTLQLNYFLNGYLSYSDSASLFGLTQLCPGTDGACIYQARALYDNLCANMQRYPDNCEGSGLRQVQTKKNNLNGDNWKVKVYPNPAKNQVNIETNHENEKIFVMVADLSGRTVMSKNFEMSGFIFNLEIPLPDGAYLISITNGSNEKVVKKIFIAK